MKELFYSSSGSGDIRENYKFQNQLDVYFCYSLYAFETNCNHLQWSTFSRPTIDKTQIIFENYLIKICCPLLNASFRTFWTFCRFQSKKNLKKTIITYVPSTSQELLTNLDSKSTKVSVIQKWVELEHIACKFKTIFISNWKMSVHSLTENVLYFLLNWKCTVFSFCCM